MEDINESENDRLHNIWILKHQFCENFPECEHEEVA